MQRKPVVECDAEEAFTYEYHATHVALGPTYERVEFIASNSLTNLLKGVKDRGWGYAYVYTKNGCFSAGQSCADEWYYKPKYKRW